MPHICTRCNNVFDSGEDILKGCPNCGWKKFMFVKKNSKEALGTGHQEPIITRAMGVRVPPKTAEKRQIENAIEKTMENTIGNTIGDAIEKTIGNTIPNEKMASRQRQSQPETVSPGTHAANLDKAIASKAPQPDANVPETNGSQQEGRALESIKITAPGTYELNLPSLFERDELIMAVKEGTYFIDLTSAFKKGKKD